MESVPKPRDPDVKFKGFPLPNGAANKPHRTPPPPPLPTVHEDEEVLYRECLKNHAASLGVHALDGCGEFMPSLAANPADPTSLKCAACGCHRNFHRRIASLNRAAASASGDDGLEGEGERDGLDDDGEEDADVEDSPPPPPYFTSAPHMLLALSSGIHDGDLPASDGRPFTTPTPTPMGTVPPLRKRFRSKFSPEQKEKMLELSERLGWRLQRRDEEFLEKYCDEIGVGKGVFKVWMHNNKHHLFGHSASRRETVSFVSPPAFAGSVAGLHKSDGNDNAMNGAG